MGDLFYYEESLKRSAIQKLCLIKADVAPCVSDSHITNVENKISKNSPLKESMVTANVDQLPVRQICNDFDMQRQDTVRRAMNKHVRKFEEFSNLQENFKEQKWLNQQKLFIKNMHEEEQRVKQALLNYQSNKKAEHQKLVLYYKDLEVKKKANAAILAAREKQKQQLVADVDLIKNNHKVFCKVYQEILQIFKTTDVRKAPSSKHVLEELKDLNEDMEMIISKCKTYKISELDVTKSTDISESVTSLKSFLLEEISKNTQPIQVKSTNFINKEIKTEVVPDTNSQNQLQTKTTETKNVEIVNDLDQYVSRLNFKYYCEIMKYYEQHVESFKEFTNDTNLKQFRFDCKKAVNVPVNAISAASSAHLADKYNKLSNLLNGKTINIGDSCINATKHPQGLLFCLDLIARKFVLQGELMISNNPKSAFDYATIIISLWNEFPHFGKLLLAHFYKQCPYLVPFYIPNTIDQIQGYEGLKKMTGIMRLYFSMFVSHPKRDQSEHPHSLNIAWTWLTSVLKLQPKVDITATMLCTFFETVGFQMQNKYNRQFSKIVTSFESNFMPILRLNDSGGPVTRLEVLMQEYTKNNRRFEVPDGMLPPKFW